MMCEAADGKWEDGCRWLMVVCLIISLVFFVDSGPENYQPSPKGRVTGSYLQGWLGDDFSEEMWNAELSTMHEIGMTYLLIQNPLTKEGAWRACLQAALRFRIKLIIGLSDDAGDYMVEEPADAGIIDYGRDIAKARATIDVVAEQVRLLSNEYGIDYGKVIYGWYFNQEFSNSRKFYTALSDYTDLLSGHLNSTIEIIRAGTYTNRRGKTVSLDRPLVLSPFFIVCDGDSVHCSVNEYEDFLESLFAKTSLRSSDIFMPQDSFGTNSGVTHDNPVLVTPESVKPWLEAQQRAARDTGMRFWINNELFEFEDYLISNKEEKCPVPIPVDRFIQHYDVTDLYAEEHLVFSWNHYYNPLHKEQSQYGVVFPGRYDIEEYDQSFRDFVLAPRSKAGL